MTTPTTWAAQGPRPGPAGPRALVHLHRLVAERAGDRAAYVLCVTIIGLPLAFVIFNQLPLILTLRPRSVGASDDGTAEQLAWWIRGIWFVLIGWWLGAIYLGVAWFLCVILITLPIGLWLMNRVGAVMTLLRY